MSRQPAHDAHDGPIERALRLQRNAHVIWQIESATSHARGKRLLKRLLRDRKSCNGRPFGACFIPSTAAHSGQAERFDGQWERLMAAKRLITALHRVQRGGELKRFMHCHASQPAHLAARLYRITHVIARMEEHARGRCALDATTPGSLVRRGPVATIVPTPSGIPVADSSSSGWAEAISEPSIYGRSLMSISLHRTPVCPSFP